MAEIADFVPHAPVEPVDTLQKRQTLSAIQVIVDLQGPIGH